MQKGTTDVSIERKVIYKSGNVVLRNVMEWVKKPQKTGEKVAKLATYVLLFDLAFVFLFPFLYMIVESLKTNADLYDLTVNWVPRTLKFQNYVIAFRVLEYTKYIKNSLVITIMATIGHVLACSFVGYGFARHDFPGKNWLFILVIVALIVPVQTVIVPMYMLYANLKWLNTYLPVILPTFFGYGLKGALFIFIFRQFYLGLPKELENAAKIDGCGFLRTYWNIVLPVARSAFMVAVVLSLVWHWNDFYEPAIYVTKPVLTILPARLNSLVTLVNNPPENLFAEMSIGDGEDTLNNAVLMAGTFMIVLPVIISFAFLQKKFIQGIERTGLVE
ncbi:MAG TPA: carbohydrate ABC transporter permease [Clostridiales bacterium]|nr:carbohydrate ABC transporter permease [Clostridiales bacterium]